MRVDVGGIHRCERRVGENFGSFGKLSKRILDFFYVGFSWFKRIVMEPL